MNRLEPHAVLADDPIEAVGSASPALASPSSACSLFGPLHYEKNYAYPLIVWLHGPGSDETELSRVMAGLSLRNYVGVAPRGTRLMPPGPNGQRGYTWLHRAADVALAESRVWECISLAQHRYNIHPDRIFLAGFDAGGTIAFRLGMMHPERFAGVLSLCGPFPRHGTPLGRLSEARRLPLFVACGRQSQRYAEEHVCGDLRLFHCAGLDITLRQYPGGQRLCREMLADANRWIMDLVTRG
jgi:phospholipase/carboxylesterase